MKKQTHPWKLFATLLLCAGCCAAPFLFGIGGVAIVTGALAAKLELILCLGLPLVVLIVFLVRKKTNHSGTCTTACMTGCGCKKAVSAEQS